MSDTGSWAPPGGTAPGATPPPDAFPPPSGAPSPAAFPPPAGFPPPTVAPGTPAAPFGPGAGVAPVHPGWTPPPKPGLIPLRPLTLGTILGASFQVLRRNPRPMFGFSLLLTALVFVATLLLVGVVTFLSIARLSTATGADADAIAAGSVAGIILSALIPIAFSIAVVAVLQGIVVLEVARGTVGEKLRLGGLWRAARGRIGALIGWSLLVTAIVVVAVVIVVLLITVLVTFGGVGGLGGGIMLGILSALAAVVLGFWLGTRLCLVPSALVLERLPLRSAIRRSWSLTTGYFWKVLGIQLLVSVILSTVSSIVSTPLSLIMSLSIGLFSPTGDMESAIWVVLIVYLLSIVVSIVVGAISAVVQSATTGLLYIDLRMRKEGLDIELARFVEARQAGDSSVPDPYAVRQPEPAA
ncbi:glycerophosphoryl diester phosphodiesterase membrane domain-containing protein [Salinibacterium soli]|uniref:Glycerophosphoryl diester phosphodiesterase membrane domain-containing protein n=1 Tax=Antiquaquibacter soli TaxID=3064523 RepID=A0ABT9BJH4_9MICO|nr:glycerophosphoryl diester phosphodiesterase membrane domain-containing protein [Protaetiibacter sp. WY-16]MDO7881175.1 glycerophosphoryl diester phosphodiesterase membrane domain-containing protein [Protaetiibacter sp. WY-16]